MNVIVRTVLLTLSLLCLCGTESRGHTGLPIYSRVHIETDTAEDIAALMAAGVAADHFIPAATGGIIVEISAVEIAIVRKLAISYHILIEDLTAFYGSRNEKAMSRLRDQTQADDCTEGNYDYGSMGGYHNLDEVLAHLDRMHELYPTLISARFAVGSSYEERPLWAVKLGVGAADAEHQSEAVVYFESLTHAREPMSMEVLLYYMWWLLEGYGTNPTAKYLLENRTIYLLPVVNPDGYKYNERIAPNGGGMIRKNRRIDSDCDTLSGGVDLNRNYAEGWGSDAGSSPDPCRQTYRGSAAFSEPESQAVRDFIDRIKPVIAYSNHSFGQKLLLPWSHIDKPADFDKYAGLASNFIPPSYFGYGTVRQMLGYLSSGNTRDFMHRQGICAMTPEIGLDGFWPSPDDICGHVQEFLPALRFATWLAGAYTTFHDFALVGSRQLAPGGKAQLVVRLKNRGLQQTARNTSIGLRSLTELLSFDGDPALTGDIPTDAFADNANAPFVVSIAETAAPGERMPLEVVTKQNGVESDRDTIWLTAGYRRVLFRDHFEGDATFWNSPGTQQNWSAGSTDSYGAENSYTDSPKGSYHPVGISCAFLSTAVDLHGSMDPRLEFTAKWSLEQERDFVQVLAGPDFGNVKPLAGIYTAPGANGPIISGNSHWVQESMSLAEYAGGPLLLRFCLSSQQPVSSDGFYVDNLQVVDYRSTPVSAEEEPTDNVSARISPNPSDGRFLVTLATDAAQKFSLSISNLVGQVLYQSPVRFVINQHVETIDLGSSAAPGIHLLRISSKGGTLVKKIVLQ